MDLVRRDKRRLSSVSRLLQTTELLYSVIKRCHSVHFYATRPPLRCLDFANSDPLPGFDSTQDSSQSSSCRPGLERNKWQVRKWSENSDERPHDRRCLWEKLMWHNSANSLCCRFRPLIIPLLPIIPKKHVSSETVLCAVL